MQANSRNISVELLRVLFMLCIVTLHSIIYRNGGAGVLPIDGGEWPSCVRYGVLGLSHIGVSGFIFISGYYGIKFNWYKVWNIWTQALFYSVIIAILGLTIWHVPFVKEALHFCMPISRSEWFVMDYVVLMLLSPFIQSGIEKISRQQFLGIILFLSLMLYVGRFFSFDAGTSFMLMLDIYLIGRYMRTYPITWFNQHAQAIMVVALAGLYLLPFTFASLGYTKLLRLVLSNYNIFALLAGSSMVILADNHPLQTRYKLNLGANVLAVFLITESSNVRNWLWGGAFAEMHPMLRIAIILAALFGCMIIDQIRQWLIVPLTDKLWNKITLKYENHKDNSMLP